MAANKCDAAAHRAVDAERGEKIAENFDMPFFEVSCKDNINIEDAFLTLARRIREQRDRRVCLSSFLQLIPDYLYFYSVPTILTCIAQLWTISNCSIRKYDE